MNKKIIIAIVAGIIFVISVIYILSSRSKQETPGQPFIRQPEIPSSVDLGNKITFDVDSESLDLPNSAYVLRTQPLPQISTERISVIASNLGYTEEPLIVDDRDLGQIYIFNSADHSTSITPNSNSISYGSNKDYTAINKQISDSDLVIIAKDFLSDNLGVDTNNLEFINFTYYKTSATGEEFEVTTKDNADFYQLNFSPVIDGKAIITLDPRQTLYFVWILPDGTVNKAAVQEIGNVENVGSELDLKDYNEIVNSVDQAKLVSLDQGNVNIPDVNSQYIKSVVIDDIELAYLFTSSEDNLLQPIYILNGTANVIGSNTEVEAVLYMPAISQS